jgi:2-C-methyl-D-erythritol 4-phosphate cytidylyltransferase
MDLELVAGGAERADTIEKALARVRPDIDFVAVHDAARPLLAAEWIDKLFQAAERTGAAIPAVPITSTIKRVAADRTITETVSREGLWQAQTPQVFRRQLLLDAYARRSGAAATDEASLVEQLGHPVSVIEGWPMNIKITTRDDFRMAEALVDALPKPQLRQLHPFEDERFA